MFMPSEPGDGFIEQKYGSIPIAQSLNLLQVARFGLDGTRRLHGHACNLTGILIKELLQRFDIVVIKLQAQGFMGLRNACVDGGAANEPVVIGKEGACAAHRNVIPARVSSCQLDRSGHHR